MKLLRFKNEESKFYVKYKMIGENQEVPQECEVISQDAHVGICQQFVFDDGKFEYSKDLENCIVAIVKRTPFIFVTKENVIVKQIPFETKINIEKGHVFVAGFFSLQEEYKNNIDQMKSSFQAKVKEDLLKSVEQQITGLQQAKKFLQ